MFQAYFKKLHDKRQAKKQGKLCYMILCQQARKPSLYTDYGVPDTLDGRLAMLILEIFSHVRHQPKAAENLYLVECFIDDIAMQHRVTGTSDVSMHKKMKILGKLYHSRMQTYLQALNSQQPQESLALLLKEHIYKDAQEDKSLQLAQYYLPKKDTL